MTFLATILPLKKTFLFHSVHFDHFFFLNVTVLILTLVFDQ